MKINLTYQLNIKQLVNANQAIINKTIIDKKSLEDYLQVLSYYGLAAKNIYNSALFIVNNILTSYEYDKNNHNYKLKNKLHDNQQDIINTVNLAINTINNKRLNKLKNKANNKSKIKKPKPLVLLSLYENTITKSVYYQIINKTVLEETIKLKEKHNKVYQDYTLVHSHLAQATIHKLCDNFNNYFKALSAYNKNKNSFNGKPRQPDYLNKKSQLTFEVAAQRFSNQGKILNISKKHRLYTDFEKNNLISKNLIDNFNNINLKELIDRDINSRINKNNNKIPSNYKLALIRVIPGKYQALPRIEYVINFEINPQGIYPVLNKISQSRYNQDLLDLKDPDQLKLIQEYYKTRKLPYFASMDCGMVNFATIGFHDQAKSSGYIVSSRKFYNHIAKLDNKIDKRKSTLANPQVRNIQSKRDTDKKINKQELALLHDYYKQLSQDEKLIELQLKKTNITKNYIHNLSTKIINDCKSKDIPIIIIGKNNNWKTGAKENKQNNNSFNNKPNNRKFHALPHAQFIDYLKYKAVLNDILVVTSEESFTSKTSFVDNEDLNVYKKDNPKEDNQTTHGTVKNNNHKSPLFTGRGLNGKRVALKFITKDKKVIHADLNASFNIARKVFDKFVYNKKTINLSYCLVELNLTGKNSFFRVFCGFGGSKPVM